MVFAFVEDGTLVVHATAADAIRQYEGIDVESGVVRFYDESGVYLEPRFTTPNRSGKWLRLVRWVESGAYQLVPNPSADTDSITLALHETSILQPNPWFATLDELKAALASRGVNVTLR
jgi:hypothetical protein